MVLNLGIPIDGEHHHRPVVELAKKKKYDRELKKTQLVEGKMAARGRKQKATLL
jgi:hypothetical protein